MAHSTPLNEPIAIVGSSCRFSGDTSTPSKLWKLISNPKDLSDRPPDNRFDADGFFHEDAEHHGTTNVGKSYFLNEDFRVFDTAFFNITPKEAEAIDPQQRILLECVYEAMESAGLTISSLQGSSTSVYVGLMIRDFMDVQVRDPDYFSKYMVTGTSSALNANRISYFFDWRGPSLTVDTACSSSLVALHQAVLGLRSGESRVACVSGSNLLLGPELFISASNMHMLSSKSRMWDTSANGYARGDGFVTLFLKTLSSALEDGDHIEAVIRETGVNSDGRTKGITMPSSEAQASLIRETYRKAGLDPDKETDRCQYFEAHGTGTQAGDPQEASAIHSAFFGNGAKPNQKLLVGSIKTVVGHTEGAAGIAGVLKAALALRHRTVPPNLHFETLNPNVAPFYDALQIPTASIPWPTTPSGVPLRASVNSFGFGGTNSHAILERYDPELHNFGPWKSTPRPRALLPASNDGLSRPLLFSANTEKALVEMIRNYSRYLKNEQEVNLRDLSWTLRARRTVLPVKAAFAGLNPVEVSKQMEAQLAKLLDVPGSEIGARSKGVGESKPCLLGVFTGQGAQWPTMGRQLILNSVKFAETIDKLETYLQSLPDGPSWSLKAELMAVPSESRLGEAALSQPLCTAIQVALVDLLQSAGIKFQAVVGHSSGEIGAAYAAGVLTAEESIAVAFYRGVHAKLARGPSGAKGSMLAAGLSLAEAQALAELPKLKSRISVAASNSPASVTLSGDEDAIKETKTLLEGQKKFVRILQVDTAYHSQHMTPCADPYIASLKACGINPREQNQDCAWISSVYGSKGTPELEELTATYWSDNMTQTVLFSQALERAMVECGPFDAILEVGPHPALKGPATQTLKDFAEGTAPYTGVLDRKKNDTVAFADALSFLWALLGPSVVDFDGYVEASEGKDTPNPKLVKDLPPYPWDHGQVHWRESRLSKEYRCRSSRSHELLGHRMPGSADQEIRWRNILRLEEVPWLSDHQIQGQKILPTGAYCSMMLDAALALLADETAGLIELHDVEIHSPVAVADGSSGVELVSSIRKLKSSDRTTFSGKSLEAEFFLSAGPPDGSRPLKEAASGRAVIFFGAETADSLPSRVDHVTHHYLRPVEVDGFYSEMNGIGLGYSGAFTALQEAERAWHRAIATVPSVHSDEASTLLVKPWLIECCIQTAYIAYASPGDGSLWTTSLPQKIGRVAFNMEAFQSSAQEDTALEISSHIVESRGITSTSLSTFSADVELSDSTTGKIKVQLENVTIASLSPALDTDDRELFFHTIWKNDVFDGVSPEPTPAERPEDLEIADALDRVARFYLRDVRSKGALKDASPAYQPLVDLALRRADNTTSKRHVLKDKSQDIAQLIYQLQPRIDLRPLKLIGEALPAMVRGRSIVPEPAPDCPLHGLLNQVPAFAAATKQLNSILQQISHRHTQLDMLEIGPGGLGPSVNLSRGLERSVSSYLFASVGSSLRFPQQTSVGFQTIPFEDLKSDAELGTTKRHYDVLICSFSLRSSQSPERTLSTIRNRLRPGGYLLLVEPTSDLLWLRFLLNGLIDPSQDGHDVGSPVSLVDLDRTLQNAGFTGVDHTTQHSGLSIIASQASDDKIQALRHPLQPAVFANIPGELLLVGGRTILTYRTVQSLSRSLQGWQGKIVIEESLGGSALEEYSSFTAAVVLEDTDGHDASAYSGQVIQRIHRLFSKTRNVLWVTPDAVTNDPNYSASTSLARWIGDQYPAVSFQSLHLEAFEGAEARIATSLIRQVLSRQWETSNSSHLWTKETDTAIVGGRTLIPRVLPANELNARLNATRRVVYNEVSLSQNEVTISTAGKPGAFACLARANPIPHGSVDAELVRVSHSTLFALQVGGQENLHLCIGRNLERQQPVLAFSTTLSSSIAVPRSWQVPYSATEIPDSRVLELAAHQIAAQTVRAVLSPGTTVIYEPDDVLASIIAAELQGTTDKQVLFLTSRQHPVSVDIAWTHVHPHASRKAIEALLPRNASAYVDLSSARQDRVAQRIVAALPRTCAVVATKSFFRPATAHASTETSLINILTAAAAFATTEAVQLPWGTTSIVSATDLLAEEQRGEGFTIVDWTTRADRLPVIVRPLTAAGSLFDASKTYTLVDVEADVAESLARWMASSGARRIVVIDATISPEPAWTDDLKYLGCQLEVEQLDCSSEARVNKLVHRLPDVAGVIYGGALNSSTTSEDGEAGSAGAVARAAETIHRSFLGKDLDFFVLLTCAPAGAGVGRWSPTAAYLTGLAAQRKSLGAKASVVGIPPILGLGAKSSKDEYFHSISEFDLHQIVAEGIDLGRSCVSGIPSLITGLKHIDPLKKDLPTWRSGPTLSHLVQRSAGIADSGAGKSAQGVKQRVLASGSIEEAAKVLRQLFSEKLTVMLSLAPDAIKEDTDLISLGIDSLVASDVRSWFLKELDAEVPVLKILGGSTVTELCEEVASAIPLEEAPDVVPAVAEPITPLPAASALNPEAELTASSLLSSESTTPESVDNSDGIRTPQTEISVERVQDKVSKSKLASVSRTENMSYSQTRLWFPSVYLDQKTPFNCTTSYRISGPLDVARLGRALEQVTQRHEIFRTSFSTDPATGEAKQSVFSTAHFSLKHLTGNSGTDVEREFRRTANYVFDLEAGDAFIASIVTHSPLEHTIIFGYHHIIMDGVSWQITLNDAASFYNAPDALLPRPAQYLDFTLKTRQLVETGAHKKKLDFWRSEFPSPPEPMPLFPFARVGTRKALSRYSTIDRVVHIDTALVTRIKKASLSAKTTSFHAYLAAFQTLLLRLLDLEHVCIGIIDANRSDPTFANTVGFLLDMLPLRLDVNRKERFVNTLRNTRTKAYAALSNSGVPLEAILRELQVPASATHTPLFQVLINYRMGALKAPQLGQAQMGFLDYEDAKAPFDLALSIDEKDDGTGMLTFSLQDYLYDRQGVDLLVKTYVHLLDVLSSDPSQRLNEVPIFDQALVSKAIEAGTGPSIEFGWPETSTVVHRVDEWVERQGEAVAVKDTAGRSLTYRQMFGRVNAIARDLQRAGARPGWSVAVFCEPTVDSICCVLAVLRIGAAYTPLDVRNSTERLAAVVAESLPSLILYHSATQSRLPGLNAGNIAVWNIDNSPAISPTVVLNRASPSEPAVNLYTSGSTGKPKGIVLTHRNLSSHFASMGSRLGLDREVVLQQSALGFDASLAQMFYALVFGGTVIMGSNRGDPAELAALIEREKVTVTLCMISEMSALLDYGNNTLSRCSAWRVAMCGGEAFSMSLLRKFRQLELPGLTLFNAYGPTETSIISSIGEIPYQLADQEDDFKVPVGPPLPNYGVYVLDDKLQPLPLGWPGELCITGPGVAPGYIGQPALTAAKFQSDQVSRGWGTIYRTGDRARLLGDGSFVFLGRVDGDSQVKLRGIRIELDDISSSILRSSEGALSNAAVLVRGETNQFLVAYVVFARDRPSLEQPKAYLQQLLRSLPLPVYMRPAVAVPVERLPFTERGKLDNKALAAIPLEQYTDSTVDDDNDPLSKTESELRDVWTDVLSEVGVGLKIRKQSDFFSVGGNSLLLMRLRAKMQEAFDVSVPLAELFQASTLEMLAARIDEERSPQDRKQSRSSFLDWEAETELPPELLALELPPTVSKNQDDGPITVILTGSTGFLGRELLRQLVASPSVAHIHCIALRPGRTHDDPTIASSPKVTSYTGDLSSPRLGLSAADARAIFSIPHLAVIHNGAEVSHLKSYHSLRTSNVHSTKQLVHLALAHHRPSSSRVSFHYVSTAGVAHLASAEDAFPETTVRPHPPPRDGSDGYVAAKWASEVFLEKAAARFGRERLSVTVHRPSNITGHGVGDRDIVHGLLRASVAMRAAPDLRAAGATGAFDFVGVEGCAAGVVAGVVGGRKGADEGALVSYEHRSGDAVVPVEELVAFLEERERGGDHGLIAAAAAETSSTGFEVLEWDEWIGRAVRLGGMDELVGAFLRETKGRIKMPLLVKGEKS